MFTRMLSVLVLVALSGTASADKAQAKPNPHADRWQRLAKGVHPDRWWAPRITLGGKITEPVRMSGTTDAAIYHDHAVDHPLTSRYQFAETWEGSLRHTNEINLLVRERNTNDVVAEVQWRDKQGYKLITPTGHSDHASQGEALHAFFSTHTGLAQAVHDATHNASPVGRWTQGFSFSPSTHVVSGVLRPSLADRGRLVLQSGWGGKNAEHDVLRIDADETPETIHVSPRTRLAAENAWVPEYSRYDPKPELTSMGQAPAPKSGAWPALSLFQIPDFAKPGTEYKIIVRRGDETRVHKVIATPTE